MKSKSIQRVYYTFIFAVIILVLYGVSFIALPLVLSLLATMVFEPVVDFFETRGHSRKSIVIKASIIATILVALVIIFVVPILFNQLKDFVDSIPSYTKRFQESIDNFQLTLTKNYPDLEIPDIMSSFENWSSSLMAMDFNKIMTYTSGIFSILSVLLIIPIATFFILIDGISFQKSFFQLLPNQYFEMTLLLSHKITSAIKSYIRGQVIDATAVAVLTAIGLSIIGLPYAIVIGLVAGIGNLIPYLGPIIGFIPASIVIMGNDSSTFVELVPVIVVFVIVQFIEGTFIYPVAVGKSVSLHPLVVMLAVTVGGSIGGLLGMLLVIPLITIIKVTVEVLTTYLKGYEII